MPQKTTNRRRRRSVSLLPRRGRNWGAAKASTTRKRCGGCGSRELAHRVDAAGTERTSDDDDPDGYYAPARESLLAAAFADEFRARTERSPPTVHMYSPTQSNRQAGVAFQDLLLETGRFAGAPELGAVRDAVAEGAAVGSLAARDGARN